MHPAGRADLGHLDVLEARPRPGHAERLAARRRRARRGAAAHPFAAAAAEASPRRALRQRPLAGVAAAARPGRRFHGWQVPARAHALVEALTCPSGAQGQPPVALEAAATRVEGRARLLVAARPREVEAGAAVLVICVCSRERVSGGGTVAVGGGLGGPAAVAVEGLRARAALGRRHHHDGHLRRGRLGSHSDGVNLQRARLGQASGSDIFHNAFQL